MEDFLLRVRETFASSIIRKVLGSRNRISQTSAQVVANAVTRFTLQELQK